MVKRRYLASAVVGAILTGAGMAGPVWAAPDDPVNFPDPVLRACVNTALGQAADAVITEQQAATVTTVDCYNRGVSDLTGAESLTGITLLSVGVGTVDDLSPLAGLTNLRTLGLGINKVTDVLPLAGLTDLEWLDLGFNKVRDLSPLAGLTKLTHFNAQSQSPAVTVPCGVPYANPVGMNGQPVALTGAGYDPASNTIDTTTEGIHQYTWSLPTRPGGGIFDLFSGTLSVMVTCAPIPAAPVITSGTPAAAATGTPYSFTVTATGTPAPTFTVSAGALPDGLTLDAATGVISGTPTTVGAFGFTITATNTEGTVSAPYTIDVNSAPAITSPVPIRGAVGTAYSHTVTATGTPAPTFTVTGALPDGLTLDAATGVISGTPTTAGTFAFTITATNAAGTATADYTITVDAAPAITSTAPAAAAVGTAYTHTVTATGSPAPLFAVSSGTLPDGLTLDAATGVISGTPTTGGVFAFTIVATNTAGTAPAAYTLEVHAAPAITSPAPAGATAGAPYSHTLTATGTPAPTFTVTGALPDGLTLDAATGVISGTPTAAGVFSFTITATSTAGTVTADYTIAVAAAPAITSTAPAVGTVGTAYAHTMTAGGTPAPTFTVTAGALPDGLALDAATGVISGTPTTAGTFAFTITATNTAGIAAAAYTMAVHEAPAITSPAPAGATVSAAYTHTITATGTPAPLFAVSTGTLPDGLTLNTATGVISGTPTTAGTFAFTITATNTAGTASVGYTIAVNAAPVPGPADTSLAATGVDLMLPVVLGGLVALLAGGIVLLLRHRATRTTNT